MTEEIVFIGSGDVTAEKFRARFNADFPTVSLHATDERESALGKASNATVLIGHNSDFDELLIQKSTKVRWIQSLTSGTDAILRLKSLRLETVVTSTRGAHGPQMSELIFWQMLSLIRDMPRIQKNHAARLWERRPQPLLAGKTIVIVGVGAIAEVLAIRANAFDMRVVGVSASTRLPLGFAEVLPREQLKRAAATADFLVLIVPHSPQTEKLIDASVIAAMKPSAFLINVARGGVLDEVALLEALRAKRLAGAALDVFRETPLPRNSPLWTADHLIITPHIGGMSDVYLDQVYTTVRHNMGAYLTGDWSSMVNVVKRF